MSTGKNKGRKESSAFRGVHWAKASNKWRALIGHKGKMKYLGTFDDEEAAAKAYDDARKKIQLHDEAAARACDDARKKMQLSKPSSVASASSNCCKKCTKPALPSNYGFCQEHRQLRPGKSTPRSGVDAPADFTCCKRIDRGKENNRRQQYSPTSKQDKTHLHNLYASAKCHAIFLDIARRPIPDRYKILQAFGPFITPS